MRRGLALAAASGLVATTIAAAAATPLPPDLVQVGAPEGRVFRLLVRLDAAPGENWIEVVAPSSGHCRQEAGGDLVVVGSRTHAATRQLGTTIRTGSPAFLAYLADACGTLAPVRARLASGEHVAPGSEFSFTLAGRSHTARVEEELTAPQAVAAGLFSISLENVVSFALERRPGERPANPIRAYWLGPAFSGRRPVRALEGGFFLPPEQTTMYDVFYELPSAHGASSAEPGRAAPVGELQVLSAPIAQSRLARDLPAAQRRYRWPRYRVRLRSRERATVYPNLGEGRKRVSAFVVVTRRTVISVTGRFRLREIPGVASALRPLPRG